MITPLRVVWNRSTQFKKGRAASVTPATIGFNTGVGPESYGIREIDIGDSASDRFSNLGLQYCAGGRVATSYQIADEANWTHGAHSWKFGFNFLPNFSNYPLACGRGRFSFTRSQLSTHLIPAS